MRRDRRGPGAPGAIRMFPERTSVPRNPQRQGAGAAQGPPVAFGASGPAPSPIPTRSATPMRPCVRRNTRLSPACPLLLLEDGFQLRSERQTELTPRDRACGSASPLEPGPHVQTRWLVAAAALPGVAGGPGVSGTPHTFRGARVLVKSPRLGAQGPGVRAGVSI